MQESQEQTMSVSDVLAQEQPCANPNALAIPTKVALRMQWGLMNILFGILGFVALLIIGLAIWMLADYFTTSYDAHSVGRMLLQAAILCVFALFFMVPIWLAWSLTRYWVKVTENDLEARSGWRKMRVVWDDARVFSIEGERRSESASRRYFTLSGKQGSITWFQILSKPPEIGLRPVLPFDIYEQQSQALLEMIVGRTGLPLYDRRLPVSE